MNTLHTLPDYDAREYRQGGYYDTAYRRPNAPGLSLRREIPQAFMNTEWGRKEAQGLHESGNPGLRPSDTDQQPSASERTLPSAGSIPYLSRARDENYLRLRDRARERNYAPPTREHVLRHPEHDPPPPIPNRSPSRGQVRNARQEHRQAEPRAAMLAVEPIEDGEVRWGLVNARRPTYAHMGHPVELTRRSDGPESYHEQGYRPRQSSERPQHIAPPQPLRRYNGRPRRPSWW